MDVRQNIHSTHTRMLDTQGLRNEFSIERVFAADEYVTACNHTNHIIVGDIMPVTKAVSIGGEVGEQLGVNYFLERRGLGAIDIGGAGTITVDGRCCEIGHRGVLYASKDAKEVVLASTSIATSAKFYCNRASAHMMRPAKKVTPDEVSPVTLGNNPTSSHHTISKHLVPDVLETCRLSMGLIELAPDNLWNTISCRTHERQMEVYSYLNMDDDTCAFHMMGQPQETRHIMVHNKQAVISPSRSIHSDAGAKAYTFIWGMTGENQVFDDMGHVAVKDLRQLWTQTSRVSL